VSAEASGDGFQVRTIDEMVGKTFTSVTRHKDKEEGNDVLAFVCDDGRTYSFWYEQDCCAKVEMLDACGDLSDLEGSPIVEAEERVKNSSREDYDESETWTFYSFSTAKGTVVIRWYGTSNGYYSETVSHGWRVVS
jgi:hypothetical protein